MLAGERGAGVAGLKAAALQCTIFARRQPKYDYSAACWKSFQAMPRMCQSRCLWNTTALNVSTSPGISITLISAAPATPAIWIPLKSRCQPQSAQWTLAMLPTGSRRKEYDRKSKIHYLNSSEELNGFSIASQTSSHWHDCMHKIESSQPERFRLFRSLQSCRRTYSVSTRCCEARTAEWDCKLLENYKFCYFSVDILYLYLCFLAFSLIYQSYHHEINWVIK